MDLARMESALPVGDEKRAENLLLFQQLKIRHDFMRKVFTIVLAQLVITSLVIAPMILHEPTRQSIRGDRGIYWASFILFIAVYLAIVCCSGLTRSFPLNYFILLVLTVSMAVWVGCFCTVIDPTLVMIAVGICLLLCSVLYLFAIQTKIDFTSALGIITIFVIAFAALSILYIFMPSKGLTWILLIGGIVLVSIYFIVDIQLMMVGKHKFSLSPEDYILAATLLYVDIIYLFLYILMILGRTEE